MHSHLLVFIRSRNRNLKNHANDHLSPLTWIILGRYMMEFVELNKVEQRDKR